MTLTGNSTILQLRKEDFINYLRINVASLIAASYDHVLFNSVSYTPSILVNVSIDFKDRHSRIVKSLGDLARHNDTLFDLSGTHFNLTSFLPAYALMAPKSDVTPFASAADSNNGDEQVVVGPFSGDPKEIEAIIYIVVGASIAFLLTASLLFAVCQCIASPRSTNNQNEIVEDRRSRARRANAEYSLEDYSGNGGDGNGGIGGNGNGRHTPKLIYSQAYSDSLISPAETEILAITPTGHHGNGGPVITTPSGHHQGSIDLFTFG